MKESNPTDLTFHGLRSRSTNRMMPVTMAVTAMITVAAIVYPRNAVTAETTTRMATAHSNAGLPSCSSETLGCSAIGAPRRLSINTYQYLRPIYTRCMAGGYAKGPGRVSTRSKALRAIGDACVPISGRSGGCR